MTAARNTVLLNLRWLQLRRAVGPFGRALLVLAVLIAIGLVRQAILNDPYMARWIAGGALLVAVGLHQRRADLHFLHRHVPQARWAMAVEYGTLMLPALVGLLLAGTWSAAAVLPMALALPWLPVARASGVRGVWLRKLIPASLFEWRSLIQGTYPWTVLLWLAALGFCWLPVLPMFLLGAIALMACGAQEACEPRAMLLATSTDVRGLLRTKLLGAAGLMSLVQLPVLIAATAFQPTWWWIHGLFGIGMVVLVAYAVTLKYANYRPNERLEGNGASVSVATVFAILPGLSLVPLIMLLSEMRNARENLKTYFDAHHH